PRPVQDADQQVAAEVVGAQQEGPAGPDREAGGGEAEVGILVVGAVGGGGGGRPPPPRSARWWRPRPPPPDRGAAAPRPAATARVPGWRRAGLRPGRRGPARGRSGSWAAPGQGGGGGAGGWTAVVGAVTPRGGVMVMGCSRPRGGGRRGWSADRAGRWRRAGGPGP